MRQEQVQERHSVEPKRQQRQAQTRTKAATATSTNKNQSGTHKPLRPAPLFLRAKFQDFKKKKQEKKEFLAHKQNKDKSASRS